MVKNKGFTIIEMMIVVVIIVILSSGAISVLKDYKDRHHVAVSTDSSSEMVINGVVHICDDFGACEPKD